MAVALARPAPSPRLGGEGWGEGASPRVRAFGKSPSPGAQERADLSPQAGRGGASRPAVRQLQGPLVTPGQILLENFLQALTAGILVGCLYGLMCTGLAIIFGVMRVINFAQGDFLMLGMYFALFASSALAALGVTAVGIAPYLAT